jgi:hypothetical protein
MVDPLHHYYLEPCSMREALLRDLFRPFQTFYATYIPPFLF